MWVCVVSHRGGNEARCTGGITLTTERRQEKRKVEKVWLRKRQNKRKEGKRDNREPVTKVKVRGELRFSSLSRFDGEFLLPQMGSKVCLFFLNQSLAFNKLPTILAIVEWSGVKWPFNPSVAECVMLLGLHDNFALLNLPLKTVSFKSRGR